MPPKKSAAANAKPKGNSNNNNKKSGGGGGSFFVSLVPLFVVAPLILAGFFEISLRFGSSFVPSEDRPPLVILPFLGFSIFPLVAWISYKASKALRRRFFLWRVLVWLPLLYLAGHNFFTILYGNINNEAYSNSWMIDVIAPPEYFEDFEAIQAEFQLATNTSRWPLALKAPSWDVDKVAANHACGPRVFVRFMAHNISAKARLTKLLDPKGLMFVGAWVLVEGKEGFRALRPKVFTDFAQGNDVAFNKWLIPRFGVDQNNLYGLFNNSFPDDETYHIDSRHAHRGDPYVVDAVDTGEDYPAGSKFLMDQYSCMTEAQLLHKVADRRWCFYKMMTAAKTRKLRGTISAPYLKEKLSFPSGSPEDCSKPYVNGVLTEDLHWLRDTYSC